MPAQTPTLLSLPRFAQVLGLHPLHFMQVDATIGSAESRVCIEPILQYTWQHSDSISREELALVIFEAEREIADVLGYWPMPRWESAERELLPQPYIVGTFWGGGRTIAGDLISLKAQYGKVISGGWRAKTLVSAAVAITYTDADSDTYFETATISVATTITDPGEIAVYYPGESGADEWEIRPIKVTISGGTATIVIRRELLVTKVLLEALDAGSVNGLINGNFLTTVDVYRKYHDPSKQVEFVWRNGIDVCSCSVGACACSLTVQNGCMTVKDDRLGIVTMEPGEWDGDEGSFVGSGFDVCRRPDYVRLWYRSGHRDMSSALPNWTMAREWEIAIAKLACTKLDRPICSCKSVQQIMERWSINLRASVGTSARSNSYKVTNYELENNPFGSSVGAMDVWRLVRQHRLGV